MLSMLGEGVVSRFRIGVWFLSLSKHTVGIKHRAGYSPEAGWVLV